MDFIVSPAVLIPRPETEHVIEDLLAHVRRAPSPANLRIVDVGTGSGCIALALAKQLPRAEIHATEISPAALEIARSNAARLELESRVQFHESDLLNGIEKSSFDFVVSNPPYVGESEEDTVQLEVRKFEPRNAVFAGPTGLEVIERLIPQAHEALKSGGWLVIEISGTIASRVKELLADWKNVQITRDLQGIERVATKDSNLCDEKLLDAVAVIVRARATYLHSRLGFLRYRRLNFFDVDQIGGIVTGVAGSAVSGLLAVAAGFLQAL
jgi:release factor glutamine methyltransferase